MLRPVYFLAALVSAAPAVSFAAVMNCPTSTTLESLVECISKQMPQHDSDGFVPPTPAQQADMQTVVKQMLDGVCTPTLPASLTPAMAIRSFTDSTNQRTYCVLMEVNSTVKKNYVDKGWGTFIVYPRAKREISHQAPHPKWNTSVAGSDGDSYSEAEAIRIFKLTKARSFLMAGSRRSANQGGNTCQNDYDETDVAHNTNNMFFPINVALNEYYGARSWVAMQWHGKAASSCSNDMFISQGLRSKAAAGAKILQLEAQINAVKPGWKTGTPGFDSCSLAATENVEGRYLNGIPAANVCGTAAPSASERFVHIEQTVDILGANVNAAAKAWAKAVNATY